jgi:putative ABC transport system permease protein
MPDPSTGSESPRAESRGDWASHVRPRLAPLRLSPTREAEIVDELSQHLEDRYRELIAGGASHEDATRVALADFQSGNVLAQMMASLRQAHVPPSIAPGTPAGQLFADLVRDVRYGLRVMAAKPGFTTVAVLSLALGIGANTAVFSLLDAVLLRPRPVSHPEQIVSVYTSDFSSTTYGSSSYPDYLDFRQRGSGVMDIAAYRYAEVSMSAGTDTEIAFAETVSGNYFPLLGIRATAGRLLGKDDDRPQAPPVAVISHALWMRRFAADPGVLGRTLQVNGRPFTIIGVVERTYTGAQRGLSVDAWVSIAASKHLTRTPSTWTEQRGSRGLSLIGRLRAGVSITQAQAAFDLIAAQLYATYAGEWRTIRGAGRAVSVVSERSSRVHPDLGRPVAGFMALLMSAVALVLLTACANIANLLLARGTVRTREIGVRLALGADRSRLVRQLLTESLMLALLGGVFGLLVAVWVMHALETFKPAVAVPVALDLGLVPSVLAFTAGLAGATGLLVGLAPALHASRTAIVPVLKDDGPSGRPRRSRLRAAFIVAQVACSTLLLIGALLFIRSLQQARAIDVGFDPSYMVVMSVNPELQGYDEPRARELYGRLLSTVGGVPGVSSVSLAANAPLGPGGSPRRATVIEGYQPQPGEDTETAYNIVGPRYFDTMRITLRRGRSFTDADGPNAPPVVIVNDAFARRYWPDGDPLGKQLSVNGSEGPFREVVGVVRTGKYNTLGEEPRPLYYLPLLQEYQGDVVLHVRTNTDPRALIAPVRDAIRRVDAAVPVFDMKTMDDHLLIALLPARLAGTLLGASGMLAVLLAAVGIYGVMAYSVAQRTREIGVRMALGASGRQLLVLVIGEGARLTGAGLAIGIVAAVGLTRLLSSLLYGIRPGDLVSFIGAALVLTASAVLACYIPARRATRVDPLVALRAE